MREAMRNNDRAFSNIESHPEGFNMLRRMYENVQVPTCRIFYHCNTTGMTSSIFFCLERTGGCMVPLPSCASLQRPAPQQNVKCTRRSICMCVPAPASCRNDGAYL